MTEQLRFSKEDPFSEWLQKRMNPNAKPKHKLVSRKLCLNRGPMLIFHTAGQPVLWQIPIRVVANDPELLQELELEKEDADVIRWVFEHDFTVQNYHYDV